MLRFIHKILEVTGFHTFSLCHKYHCGHNYEAGSVWLMPFWPRLGNYSPSRQTQGSTWLSILGNWSGSINIQAPRHAAWPQLTLDQARWSPHTTHGRDNDPGAREGGLRLCSRAVNKPSRRPGECHYQCLLLVKSVYKRFNLRINTLLIGCLV